MIMDGAFIPLTGVSVVIWCVVWYHRYLCHAINMGSCKEERLFTAQYQYSNSVRCCAAEVNDWSVIIFKYNCVLSTLFIYTILTYIIPCVTPMRWMPLNPWGMEWRDPQSRPVRWLVCLLYMWVCGWGCAVRVSGYIKIKSLKRCRDGSVFVCVVVWINNVLCRNSNISITCHRLNSDIGLHNNDVQWCDEYVTYERVRSIDTVLLLHWSLVHCVLKILCRIDGMSGTGIYGIIGSIVWAVQYSSVKYWVIQFTWYRIKSKKFGNHWRGRQPMSAIIVSIS